ncbi:dihydrodipicolinate synthase family protein [Lacticaseibacillus parakribbianus]|uniref:dihydrodipicolinate synthase family protein n=1 Tax=Lacticaseibacillus parakribbianus TaxID=2970927 RepID=UPI0021CB249F|nr:dihydrodipicolinate synthase family protein [Lacticaseibacillus parakribbianus]
MTLDPSDIKGIIVPLLTPVDADENIDDEKLAKQVNHVIDHGVDGILAFGSNSEFYMFDDDELLHAADVIVKTAAGRVPVFFGIGQIRTKHVIRLAQAAVKLGVDAISVLQPMFIHPTDEALYHHYKAIADSIPDTRVLIYNNPGLTGYTVKADTIVDLAHNVDNIVGIKDSSGDITFDSELLRRTQDIAFQVLVGKDTVIFPALCLGAVGAVCSTANIFPDLVTSIYDLYEAGDVAGSRAAQFRLNPVRLSQNPASFPAATKDMANLMGLNVGASVLPTEAANPKILADMKAAMIEAGLL